MSSQELETMLSAQRKHRLASIGARLSALDVPEELRALAEQHEVPPVVLSQLVITLGQLVLVPEEIAKEYAVFPFDANDDAVLLAMATPGDRAVVEEMEFLTGKQVEVYVAREDDIRAVIPAAYRAHRDNAALYAGADVSPEERDAVGLQPVVVEEVEEGVSDQRGPDQRAEQEPRGAVIGATEAGAEVVALSRGEAAEVAEPEQAAAAEGTSVAAAAVVAVGAPGAAVQAGTGGPSSAPEGRVVPPPVPAPGRQRHADESPRLDPAFSEPPMVAAAPAGQVDLSDKRLLVGDADGSVSEALGRLLAPMGLQLSRATTGQATLAAVGDPPPDLVVIDATLPEVPGLEVCRRFRAHERTASVPLLVFSDVYAGWRLEADLRDCYGAEGLFEKPGELERLAATALRILQGKPATDVPPPLTPEVEAELRAGMAAFEAGDLDRAIAHLEAGVRLDPEAFQMQYHLGLLYGRREDLFLAMQALEAAARLQKRHYSALKNLAVVYQRARFRRKALETWERAMWTAPDEETRRTIKHHMVTLL